MTDLILALDVTNREKALSIARGCAPHLDAIKLGYPLILSSGLSIVKELQELGLPLIADFKVADIPNTNKLIADQVFAAGFSSIICHGFPGKDSVQACVDSCTMAWRGVLCRCRDEPSRCNRIFPRMYRRKYRKTCGRMRR